MRRVHVVWCLCALLVGWLQPAASASGSASPATPQAWYVRLQVTPKLLYHVEFRGSEVRIAPTVRGLAAARPVSAKKGSEESAGFSHQEFAASALPAASSALPKGFTKALVSFTFLYYSREGASSTTYSAAEPREEAYVIAKVGLSRPDAKRVTWTYWVSASQNAALSPVSAPVIKVPALTSLALQLTAQPAENNPRELGLAVVVKSGEAQLEDITRNGKSAAVQVRLTDDKKVVAAARTGPLTDFGMG